MKRAWLWFAVAVVGLGFAGPVWAQGAPGVTLDVLNATTAGTNVAVVQQGDAVQVQYAVDPLMDTSGADLVQLRRLDNQDVVSQQERGAPLSGTVSLSTASSSAVGDLEAVYVAVTGAVLATAPQVVRVTAVGPAEVTVPSRAARTIQAAIDLVADGGTIQIGPGVYREKLLVVGKRVNLVGSGPFGLRRTLIAGTLPRAVPSYEQAQGLVSFGPGGGGSVSNLILQGGDAGVVGLEADGSRPAALQIEDVVIRLTGRGVLGTFGDLKMERVAIAGTSGNGVSIVSCAALDLLNGMIADTGGVGVLIYNLGDAAGDIVIENENIAYFADGGIVVAGGANGVTIDNCLIGPGWLGGIVLLDAASVSVRETRVLGIYEGGGPQYQGLADGLIAAYSDYVVVDSCSFTWCERAGIDFCGSGGVIANTQSGAHNRIGLVAMDDPKPDYSDPNNAFSGTDTPIITDGALSVPEAPPLP